MVNCNANVLILFFYMYILSCTYNLIQRNSDMIKCSFLVILCSRLSGERGINLRN